MLPQVIQATSTPEPAFTTVVVLRLSELFHKIADFAVFLASQKLFWFALIATCITFLAYHYWCKFRDYRKELLTSKLSEELKKSCRKEKYQALKDWLEQLYFPSWSSVGVVVGAVALLFLVSHIKFLNVLFEPLAYGDSNHYQNLIAIHAGIGAIIFALLIFMAESLRDDETKDRARVLLRESFLFPLTVAEILGFLVYIWGDINFWSILPPLIVAALTIVSLWRLLSVLLSKAKFAQKRVGLLQDRLRRSIGAAISERYGNNILLGSLGEGKIELSYYPWTMDPDEQSTHHCFYAEKNGVITNIRFNKLKEFAELAEQEANKNGFSFYKEKPKPEFKEASGAEITEETNTTKYQQADRQYLAKKYRDAVDEENLVLLAVEKRTIKDEEVLKKLARLAKEAFVIKKQENFSEEIKLEIDGLKGQFIRAIEEKRLDKIEELSRTYMALAESFLKEVNRCGGGYTYEQAQKERGAFFGGWNEIRWLSDSIRTVMVKAAQTHDPETIRDVAYIPVGIAIRAIKYRDQYVYQEFLRFPSYLYWLSLSEEKKEVREIMIDRSWRHLKEMSDYYIEHQLKRKLNDVSLIKQYAEFSIPIFVAFQDLLKTAFDKKDYESFSEFLGRFNALYDDLTEYRGFSNAEHIRLGAERAVDPKIKAEMLAKAEVEEEREKAAKDIQQRKEQVVFGLASWIFFKYRTNNTDTDLQRFYNEIANRLPTTLPDLTGLYISSRTFETEHFWNWDNWEIIPDAGVQHIDFHAKLDTFYIVKSLQILSGMNDEQITQTTLPHSRDLAFQAETRHGSSTLISILDGIAANPDQWAFALRPQAIEKVESMKTLLANAKKAQEEQEERFLETVEIDPDKRQEFKEKLLEAFHEGGVMRPLLLRFGAYKDLTEQEPKKDAPSWGYNQIDRKEAFIKDWYVHFGNWGENYGEGMASSENQLIFEQMVGAVGVRKEVQKDNLINELDQVLESRSLKEPVVLHTLSHFFEYDQLAPTGRFKPHYGQDTPKTKVDEIHGYIGVLKVKDRFIPIIRIYENKPELKNKILVVDLPDFGDLEQYSPISTPDKEENREGIFFLKITDLNQDDDRRAKILADNPAWLEKYPDKEAYLRRQVLINLFEKFQFVVRDAESGILIDIQDPPPEDD